MERKIEEIVSKNYQNPHFNVNGLSSKLNISRVHLNSIMNFGFGCSPQVYIEKIRIEKAQQSLLEGKKIIDVCKEAGYCNKKTFHLAFKKITGITPNYYRIITNAKD